jgi:hypothetical protein
MATKTVKGYRVKDGKLVRIVPFMAGAKKRKADRAAKAWAKASRKTT